MQLSNYTNALAYYERALEGMHRKIVKTYGLTPKDMAIPEDNIPYLNQTIDTWMNDPKWQRSCTKALEKSGFSEGAKTQVEALTRSVIARHLDSFMIRSALLGDDFDCSSVPEDHRGFYGDILTRENMVNLYGNHIANWGEAKFEELGLTPSSAHVMNGHAIGMACNSFRLAVRNTSAAAVYPRLGHTQSGHDQELTRRIAQQHDYPTPIVQALSARHQRLKAENLTSIDTSLS